MELTVSIANFLDPGTIIFSDGRLSSSTYWSPPSCSIDIRHGCEERDGFEKYGWLKHDGRSFGVQQLKDTANNVELTTEFIKVPGGENGTLSYN